MRQKNIFMSGWSEIIIGDDLHNVPQFILTPLLISPWKDRREGGQVRNFATRLEVAPLNH